MSALRAEMDALRQEVEHAPVLLAEVVGVSVREVILAEDACYRELVA